MMQTATESVPATLSLDDLPIADSWLRHDSRPWLSAIRRAGLDHFNATGLPTRRDEEWRYTNLAALRKTGYVPAFAAGDARDDFAALADEAAVAAFGHRLTFVNGRFEPALSELAGLPAGVIVTTLSEESEAGDAAIKAALCSIAGPNDSAFHALNAALFEDVILVKVPAGVRVEEPIYALSMTTHDAPLLSSPRTLIVVEDAGAVTVVEDFISRGDASHFTNAVTEVIVGAEADVQHYTLVRENAAATNISTLRSRQAANSRFSSHSILLGGALIRNNVHPSFEGEGCWSLLNGVYIGEGAQQLDNHMRVEHNQPHCESRQFYKGILWDKAHGVFGGRIVVAKGAQKTDAVQSSQGLLLSDTAQIQNKPQLEIYADDVKCTHGATVGQMDEQALFYLRSRGVDARTARAMLVYAFAGESLQRMEHEPIRSAILTLLLDKLPDSGAIEETLA